MTRQAQITLEQTRCQIAQANQRRDKLIAQLYVVDDADLEAHLAAINKATTDMNSWMKVRDALKLLAAYEPTVEAVA